MHATNLKGTLMNDSNMLELKAHTMTEAERKVREDMGRVRADLAIAGATIGGIKEAADLFHDAPDAAAAQNVQTFSSLVLEFELLVTGFEKVVVSAWQMADQLRKDARTRGMLIEPRRPRGRPWLNR